DVEPLERIVAEPGGRLGALGLAVRGIRRGALGASSGLGGLCVGHGHFDDRLARSLLRPRILLALAWMRRALVARQRADHHVDGSARELGLEIGVSPRRDLAQEPLHNLEPELRVRHLAAPEAERRLDLHFLAEEVDRVGKLRLEVVRIDGRAELDLLDLARVVVLAILLLPFLLLVLVLAEIDDPADGRIGIGSNLNEVHAAGSGEIQGVSEGEYPQLLAVISHDPDFAGADLAVNSNRGPAMGVTRRVGAAQST